MEDQTKIQRIISLAQSEHAQAVLELLSECTVKQPLIASDEFNTIVRAVTLDAESNLILRVSDKINSIKRGEIQNVTN